MNGTGSMNMGSEQKTLELLIAFWRLQGATPFVIQRTFTVAGEKWQIIHDA